MKLYKTHLATLGFNTRSLIITLESAIYPFDDTYRDDSISALSNPLIDLEVAVDLIECIIAALETRIDDAGELELSAWDEECLKTRLSNYSKTLRNLNSMV